MVETEKVLIAGAGPAGLAAALVLAEGGVPVTVFEAGPGLAIDLRAGSYHPPTLEMLTPFGITARMHEEGIVVPSWQIRDREAGLLVEFDLGLLRNDTPYPYRLHLEQHKLTPLMLERLRQYPHFAIEFDAKLVACAQDADGVWAEIETAGERRRVRGSYLVGAEGIRSVVREAMATEFEGFTWPEAFLIVSTTHDYAPHGFAKATYIADPDEWVMLFKVPGLNPPPLWRIALPADPERPREETLDPDRIQARLQGFLPNATPYDIVHRNTYRVHQRVAKTYNFGRFAIAGDAAHVNNPLGAMGLNGAVHDAINLGEKIAAAWRGEAGTEILDRYTRQRRPPQIEFVQRITIANKRLVEERDPKVRRARQDELRRLAADRDRLYEYVLESSMIAMVRNAATIE